MNYNKKLTGLLESLSSEERTILLRELLADYWKQPVSREENTVLSAERWFMDRIKLAGRPGEIESRQRLWVIFLFLRYGGLRFSEVASLSGQDINLDKGLLYVGGEFTRLVPLPIPVVNRLKPLAAVSRLFSGPKPLRCDASQLRRALRVCARELGLDRNLLTVRALHSLRALELQRSGIHPQLVKHFFYGKTSASDYFRNPEVILIKQVQKEIKMTKSIKTSARNVFRGAVTSIDKHGLQVDVRMQTEDGLEVSSIITQTSLASLELEVGKPVIALVKAPWVRIFPLDRKLKSTPDMNVYEGEIEAFNTDEQTVEIMLKLKQGDLLCAVYAGEKPEAPLVQGDKVTITISAFSVILMAG